MPLTIEGKGIHKTFNKSTYLRFISVYQSLFGISIVYSAPSYHVEFFWVLIFTSSATYKQKGMASGDTTSLLRILCKRYANIFLLINYSNFRPHCLHFSFEILILCIFVIFSRPQNGSCCYNKYLMESNQTCAGKINVFTFFENIDR